MSFKLKRESRQPVRLESRFERAPGCQWAIAPGAPPSSTGRGSVQVTVDKGRDGALVMILSYLEQSVGDARMTYHPVVFDAGGKRHLPGVEESQAGAGLEFPGVMLAQHKYRLDPAELPADKAVTFGIEAVPPDTIRAARQAAADKALEQARAKGVDLLPWPRVGEAYDFAVEGSDGRVLRSADLKGNVVVIDCWATWCSPCMAKMPQLKEMYEKRHGDGLEVIGINLDHDPKGARRAIEASRLPWAQVLVPADEPTRELWEAAMGLDSIPRLLVIDRDGILRHDGGPHGIEEQVARWLDRPGAGPKR